MAKKIYNFPSKDVATISEVGGKGFSLMLSSRNGLPVPAGFILPVAFFEPWIDELKKSSSWPNLNIAKNSDLAKVCSELKSEALQFSLTENQKNLLSEALAKYDEKTLFAVRSSSPEEDLEGVSFAGGYETVLGVIFSNLESAIKRAFSSCLEYRVAAYKLENGFDVSDPKIAVIVQEQILSEVAGVGFSMNPVTNNFDEAILNANWGLGETVVSGTITPDAYFVDKVSMVINSKILGKKENSLWLTLKGTIEKKTDYCSDSFALENKQILELANLIKNVEELYAMPIDIEWAYAKDKLYLLQVRPVTAYVPLASEMLTRPGDKKRLYIDVTISIQGIYQPISMAGTSFFSLLLGANIGKKFFLRDITHDISSAIPWVSPGRLFVNLSNILKFADKNKVADFVEIFDPIAAKAISAIDEKEYASDASRFKLLPLGLIAKLPRIFLLTTRAKIWPERVHLQTQRKLALFVVKARAMAEEESSLSLLTNKLMSCLIEDVFLNTVPLFISGKIALREMKKIAGKDLQSMFEPLGVALKNNVTTQMGLNLYRVSEFLPKNLSAEDVANGLANKTLPANFISSWKDFLDKYGHRGSSEIDVAAPRYSENPRLLIGILISMQAATEMDNPIEKFALKQAESRDAYEDIHREIQKVDESSAKKFETQYEIFETFAGYRETHKLYLAFVTDLLRKRILERGQLFYETGRLQSVEQIFDLTFEQMDMAAEDKQCDLLEIAKKNRKFIDKLANISNLPSVIDSRGLIIRPPSVAVREGEVAGTPISPGVVRGLVKILHSPDEKILSKGEILVARATDPGWTPLFVNAAAVILEIGGVLQHGALVAREYGLPCVAGIENATTLWEDGQLVEVNGATGIIKTILKAD